MPSRIGSYDRKGDPNNFLHLFEGAIRMQKWLMLIACHMFTYTLKDSARIWWNSQVASLITKISKQSSDRTLANGRTRSLVKHLSADLPLTYKGRSKRDYGHDTNDFRHLKVQIQEAINSGKLSHLIKGIKKKKAKSTDTPRGEGEKYKSVVPVEAPILVINREDCATNNTVSESMAYKEGIMFPPVTRVSNALVIIEAVGNESFAIGKCHLALKMQATYQRLVDKVFSKQIGRNLEAYVPVDQHEAKSEEVLIGVEEGLFLGHLITKQGIKANPSKIKTVTKLEQPRALKDIHSLNGKLAALSRFLLKGVERSLPFFKELKSCKAKKKIHWTDKANKAFKEMKKVLQGAKLNYLALENLIFALVHATRRLRRYFQAHTIMVLTGMPIKQALTRSEKTGRVAKWAIELGEHDIVFLKRDERETPIDFLPEIPFDYSKKRVKEKEVSSNEWKLYTDGASNSNGAGLGLMLIDPTGKEYTYALRFEFETNNKAEYEALLAGLHIAQEIEFKKVAIFLDSQLVVKQIKGTYAAK
nr:hypothetical protein [Tanacetum cinerariifolium]